jgi:hypothetical protein
MKRITALLIAIGLLVVPGIANAWDGLDIPDLRGTWVVEWSTLDGQSRPSLRIEVTAYDDTTGAFAGQTPAEGLVVSTLTGTRANEQATMRIDDTAGGSWSILRGVFALEPLPVIRGAYTVDRENLGDGDVDGVFEMRMKKSAGGGDATGPDGAATVTDLGQAPGSEGSAGAPETGEAASPCDLSRLESARAAFEGQTPYTSTLAMNSYQGGEDELSYDLLVSERVEDPATWDRVTAIPVEGGWSIFETRRLGDRTWQRVDGGTWVDVPADTDVLGTPWPLDVLVRQLLPGGQAGEPALISSTVRGECVISLLFRTEDGGKGEGRMARLTFAGEEALPRSIEFLRAVASTARTKKGAGSSRPGDIFSLVMTVQPGPVESVVAPVDEVVDPEDG